MVTISTAGRDHDLVVVDLERARAVLEQVGEPGPAERDADPQPRRSPAAGGLVQPDDRAPSPSSARLTVSTSEPGRRWRATVGSAVRRARGAAAR